MRKCIALVVAAGRGHRLGGDIPKQYRMIAGRPVLRHALARLLTHPAITSVRVVIHPDDRPFYEMAVQGLSLAEPIMGGETRQQSVRLGLEALQADAPDFVLLHDGARPFPDAAMINRVIAALADHNGAVPALPLSDTLKRGNAGLVGATVDRSHLWRAQTPQGFRYRDILSAHNTARSLDLTDDAALFELMGWPVALVQGSEDNIKITLPSDLERAERLCASGGNNGETRTATGFDVHRFCPGNSVVLCGHVIPHTHGLEGHSDADVGLHALTDALLGCLSAGDIGLHFPPSDPRWKGAASDRFLRHAASLVAARGGRIVHVDVTLLCEAPKIGPHREAMIRRVADILEISDDRVSIKATTTEGLGFTGRREGIAAQASATIVLPF